MFRNRSAGSKFDGRLVNELGAQFIRDLKADYLANGAEALFDLRKNAAPNYFNLVLLLSSGEVRRYEPTSVGSNEQQSAAAVKEEVKDPYSKLNRLLAIDKLKKELARLEAEEETVTRAANEELDRHWAEARAKREAADKARSVPSDAS